MQVRTAHFLQLFSSRFVTPRTQHHARQKKQALSHSPAKTRHSCGNGKKNHPAQNMRGSNSHAHSFKGRIRRKAAKRQRNSNAAACPSHRRRSRGKGGAVGEKTARHDKPGRHATQEEHVRAVPETGRAVHDARRAASGAKQQNGKKTARPAHVPGALSAHISHCYITVLTASSMPSGGYLCFFAQPLDKAAQSGKRQRAMINRADARHKKNTCRRYRKQAAQCTTHAGPHPAQSSKMAAERQGGAVQEKSLRRNKPGRLAAQKNARVRIAADARTCF